MDERYKTVLKMIGLAFFSIFMIDVIGDAPTETVKVDCSKVLPYNVEMVGENNDCYQEVIRIDNFWEWLYYRILPFIFVGCAFLSVFFLIGFVMLHFKIVENVDDDKMYCPNCGHEASIIEEDGQDIMQTKYVVSCENCDTKCVDIMFNKTTGATNVKKR